jgi:mannose-6-phosphate isomerase-like protein (cupin superfamily)
MDTNKAKFVRRGAGQPTRVRQPSTQYKALGADTSGVYTFAEHQLTIDLPLHVHHREDECLYIIDGKLTAVIGAETFSLESGDFILMPRGVPHSLTNESDPSARFVFVSTPGGFEHVMDDFVEVASKGHGPSSPEWGEVEARHELKFL